MTQPERQRLYISLSIIEEPSLGVRKLKPQPARGGAGIAFVYRKDD